MTVEPPARGSPAVPQPSGTSPLRWAIVIVPILVIVAVATNLLGLWTTAIQQAAREESLKQRKREIINTATEKVPVTNDPRFDPAVVVALIADASPEDGVWMFRVCSVCHAAEKNAPHRVAPTLWGIVGSRKAARTDFTYSAALKAKGGRWSYGELAEYLNNPRTFAPGTSMAFAGIADDRRMANLIAYLRTLSDQQVPLPN